MLGRLAVLSAAIALTACAGVESAGRTARAQSATASAPRAAPVSTPAPTPPPPVQTAPVATAPLPPPQPQQSVAAVAPRVTAPPPAAVVAPPPAQARAETPPAAPAATTETAARQPLQTRRTADDNVVVRGQNERQVEPPRGDPRSTAERMQDINAWDRCVTRVQAAYETDPMRPQLDSPEEYCRQSLGMHDREAVPESRRQRPR